MSSIETTTGVIIRVGSESMARENFTMHWLTDQLRRQRSSCVQVEIEHLDAHVLLSSGGCPAGPGGSRLPNRKEQAILDLWRERGMKESGWAPGNLNAFLQQLRKLL